MPWGWAAAAAATIGAGVLSSNAAGSAAKTQAQSADAATGLQRDIYNQNRSDLAPWRDTGSNALKMLADSLGVNGPDAASSAGGAFQKTPGYDFSFSEGQRAVDSSAAAKGMLRSGATIKAQTRFGQNTANQEYGGWLNKLGVLAGVGQTANAQQQQGAQAYATNTGNLMQDAAAARASGYVNSASAWNGAANGLSRMATSYAGGNSDLARYDTSSGNWIPGPGGF